MSALFRNLRFWNRLYVAHLEEEIIYLRGEVARERQRAENAIDSLLNVRVAVQPVSVPPAAVDARIGDIMDRLAKSEFSLVGDAESE